MGQQKSQVDVESQQGGERRRGSCLDTCLIMSVSLLFLSVAALAACGVMVVTKLRSELENSRQISVPGIVERLAGTQPSPAFKMENFAFVETTRCNLHNSTMPLASIAYGEGTSIGSNFVFDKAQHSLKPQKKGAYFMYADVKLSCTSYGRCNAGTLKLKMGNVFTCDVELEKNKTHVKKQCWTVSPLETNGVNIRMVVPQEGLSNWKLDTNSGFGMFLID